MPEIYLARAESQISYDYAMMCYDENGNEVTLIDEGDSLIVGDDPGYYID